jgi:hypothetical protein
MRFCYPLCLAAFDKASLQVIDGQMSVKTRSSLSSSSSSSSSSSPTIDVGEEAALAAALGPQGVREALTADTDKTDAKSAEKARAMKKCLAILGLEVVSEMSVLVATPSASSCFTHTCPFHR